MKTKKCISCKQVKNLTQFPIARTIKTGYKGTCRDCTNGYQKEYKLKNKSKMKKYRNRFFSNRPFYSTWIDIKQRCYNENNKAYKNYGARGITMQPEWINDYRAFEQALFSYLGDKPTETHTIDRINNDKGYFLYNMRWATQKEQQNNRRDNLPKCPFCGRI